MSGYNTLYFTIMSGYNTLYFTIMSGYNTLYFIYLLLILKDFELLRDYLQNYFGD